VALNSLDSSSLSEVNSFSPCYKICAFWIESYCFSLSYDANYLYLNYGFAALRSTLFEAENLFFYSNSGAGLEKSRFDCLIYIYF
jgi:hypothetical protein